MSVHSSIKWIVNRLVEEEVEKFIYLWIIDMFSVHADEDYVNLNVWHNVQRGETEMQIIVDFCYMTDYMLLTLEMLSEL